MSDAGSARLPGWGRLAMVLVAVGVLASGCGGEDANPAPKAPIADVTKGRQPWDELYTVEVDGRECIVWDGDRAGGLSCDWSDR